MDDRQFQKLLDYLGYSWAGYRKVRKGVKKRIRRHMQRLGCGDINTYLNIMTHQADSRQECELLMTVAISRFFRDRPLWEMLEHRWLPEMIAENIMPLSVWSAGCGCGEEVYSFKIIWEQLKKRFELLPPLEVLATDRHPQYIGRAQSGIYNRSSLREAAAEEAAAFFERRKASKQFVIKEELKSNIRWEIRHLLDDPPERVFNLIFLRNNILTYCCQKDQIRALSEIIKHLEPGGLFIIGLHETLPIEVGNLVPTPEIPYVYKKK
jgi:chemotaxis protein methyltransferase CheR